MPETLRLLALGLLACLGSAVAAEDARGLLLPNLRVLPPTDVHLVDQRPEGPLRLKFTTVIWNAGEGPMEVRGDPDAAEGDLRVTQYLYDADGRARPERDVGTFDFEHRHGHLHLVNFARYELWSLGDDGQPLERVAANEKVGFCLMDNRVVDAGTAPPEPVYGGCEAAVQGISPGWGDEYLAQLFEQDLDVTDLAPGRYRLRHEANPDGVLHEADRDDNHAFVDVVLEEDTVRVTDTGAVP